MVPRVLLADDHSLLLDAFEKLLTGQCQIVGKVGDGRALIAAADELQPDVIVLDIGMPRVNGLEAAREIKRKHDAIKLVFLTVNEDADLVGEAFRAGASGYLLKRCAASELWEAIRVVTEGRTYITPLVANGFMSSVLDGAGRGWSQPLTARQREVLQLIAEGRSMKEVGAVLGLTPRTVAFHKYRIMKQLDIKSTAELIQYAVRHSVVP